MKICRLCGKTEKKELEAEELLRVKVVVCSACQRNELAKWVPPIFMQTEIDKIPNKSVVNQVLSWRPGKMGLLICGASGAGKTRLMWELIKRVGDRYTPVFSPGPASFGSVMAEKYRDGEAEAWIKSVSEAPLVAFDDITKMKFTDRVEEQFFGVIDHRTCYELPILATIQGPGKSIREKLSDDRGVPLIRRLREFCDVVDM